MERERKDIELKAEETRNAKERIFREKVAEHEKKIDEKTAAVGFHLWPFIVSQVLSGI